MEKRKAPRAAVSAVAMMQRLGISPGENGAAFPVQVVDAGESGMRLLSQVSMDAGQAVKIEIGDLMFLGEICYSAVAPGNAGYHLGVVTQECLSGLHGLQHLIQALSSDSARELQRSR